jgi:CRP-like cAMP-binding protein
MTDLFFDYGAANEAEGMQFLGDRSQADWSMLLGFTDLRRFAPGDKVIRKGDTDRSLYLLLEGRLRSAGARGRLRDFEAPSVVGEVAFFDGGARSTTLVAVTTGEVRRLGLEGFEALSARHPDLGRAILLDLGRIIARRLRLATELLGDDVG